MRRVRCKEFEILDCDYGGVIVATAKYDKETGEHVMQPYVRQRDLWKFRLCPYCGRKSCVKLT